MVNNKFVDAWILMWGLTYLFCAIIKPDIFEGFSSIYGFISMATIGGLMLAGLFLGSSNKSRIVLFFMGVFETMCGIISWSGAVTWNIPFQDKAIFNVSMAFLDFIGATVLFTKSMEMDLKNKKLKVIINSTKNEST